MYLRHILIPLILTGVVLGLSGCCPDRLRTSPMVDPVETETPLIPTLTPHPTQTFGPAPPASKPRPGPSPVPGVAPELPPIEPTLIIQGDRSLPYVALTFDACQTTGQPTGYDETIIRILDGTNTPATLFLGGLWMQSHPTQTRSLATNPLFELGNHSWSHPDFAGMTPEQMSVEILRTQDIMYNLTGRQPRLFRFPFDTYTDEALATVGQHGLLPVQGDVITGDADPHISTRDIIDVATTQTQNGSIIIMHVNERGWHTAEALPVVIQRLRAQGYTFVTVSQLLGLAPLSTPVPHEDEHP
jgi:peptidoglycan/xylan/chitin deacetylase (PgdA/CDA1 family)